MARNFFSGVHIFSSIRSKFIAIFVILGLIPLLVMGYFSYNSASNALLLQTQEQLGNLADKTAQQIDTFFEIVEKDINLLAELIRQMQAGKRGGWRIFVQDQKKIYGFYTMPGKTMERGNYPSTIRVHGRYPHVSAEHAHF